MSFSQSDSRVTNTNDLANQAASVQPDPTIPTAESSLLELTVPSVDLAQGIASHYPSYLDIAGPLRQANDADVTRFFATHQNLESLTSLDFFDCPNITDLSLRTIEENLARMPLLISMRFGNTQVTDDAANKFADSHPIEVIMDPAAKNFETELTPYYAGTGKYASKVG